MGKSGGEEAGLQERIVLCDLGLQGTLRGCGWHAGVYLERLVCVEILTKTLTDSVRNQDIWYAKLGQTNMDEEYSGQSK